MFSQFNEWGKASRTFIDRMNRIYRIGIIAEKFAK
jgi:hypothetical protein